MRKEKDSMGEMEVPDDAYYGASTKRAVMNFPISDLRFARSFIRALCLIKLYGCAVNEKDGVIDKKKSEAIQKASREAAEGKFDDQFVVDIFQTGSGTSTNMNANEVIASRAIEILTGARGGENNRSLIHPNDHVNAGMSSNDAIPTAIHIAALIDIKEKLEPALTLLEAAFEKKSQQFMGVIKTGRTHLQDATPILLGQEFLGYKGQIERAKERLQYARTRLESLALGGTAVGTGINTKSHFAREVIELISKDLKINLKETTNHFQAQSSIDEIVDASGVLKTIAVSLLKIANDIRFMGCGPRAGFGEIQLPAVQPGSSIMPGKVNPVIAESLAMVCAQVIGNDVTINIAGQSGNFELNVMLPIACYNLLQSINLLASASQNFAKQCIEGLEATAKGPQMVEAGLSLCTALVPAIGYDASARIAHLAYKSGKTIKEVAKEETSLSQAELNSLLDPHRMISQSD
ncbi:MAG: class II fumarate hydratase [Candidatus Melainabacteria bacterium]|nr:class II fumarate hydratase [Candidatus Melainabacteria bacterium]